MTAKNGDMAEGAVLGALVRLGCTVLVPFGQGQPYDLVVHRGPGDFVTIQVKTGWEREGRVLFNSCSTDHGRGRQDYVDRADLFAVYFPPLDQVFIVPVAEAATRTSTLRLYPTANNQSRRIRLAEDHQLELFADQLLPGPTRATAVAA